MANFGITDASFTAEKLPVESWNTMIDINLTGSSTLASYRDRSGPGSALVLVSWDLGTKQIGGLSHYAAAKIGVRNLAQSLAKELGAEGSGDSDADRLLA